MLLLLAGFSYCLAQTDKPLLLQQPALSRTQIVFVYAGDLWLVPRDGGMARRLAAGPGAETAPYSPPDGEWEIENHRVAPDIEVEHDPQALRQGRGPQLERAVQYVLDELKNNPPPQFKRPAYPNYHE